MSGLGSRQVALFCEGISKLKMRNGNGPESLMQPLRELHDCQVGFRHDKHWVVMFLTRLLTNLAHLYNLIGLLKMQNHLLL